MRRVALVTVVILAAGAIAPSARADMVGAAAGAGTGLIVAGPVGAVAGGVIGGFFGQPFWGPPNSPEACWIDNNFHRHCSYRYRHHHH
jgi:osmotically inducible lipoprotein OsmB